MRELTAAERELVDFAREVVDAHGDGERHTVGAAVRDATGRMFRGLNLYHFTGGPCAELVALGHARAEGARELTTIVAVGDAGRGVLAPCGRDRQVLFEHHPGIRVLVATADGLRSVPVAELLPWAYSSPAPAVRPLRFHPDYLDAVLAGEKTTTVRFRDPVETGPVSLLFESDEEVVLPGRVTRVVAKRVAELTEEDAQADGFRDLAELGAKLRFHYPGIAPQDAVTVVHFEVTG